MPQNDQSERASSFSPEEMLAAHAQRALDEQHTALMETIAKVKSAVDNPANAVLQAQEEMARRIWREEAPRAFELALARILSCILSSALHTAGGQDSDPETVLHAIKIALAAEIQRLALPAEQKADE